MKKRSVMFWFLLIVTFSHLVTLLAFRLSNAHSDVIGVQIILTAIFFCTLAIINHIDIKK